MRFIQITAKFSLYFFRCEFIGIVSKSSIRVYSGFSRIHFPLSPRRPNFCGHSPVNPRLNFPICTNYRYNQYEVFLQISNISYHAQFPQKIDNSESTVKGWLQSLRNLLVKALIGSGVVVIAYLDTFETVPYSKRPHLVFMSKTMERKIGERLFKEKEAFGKILPETHPSSVRVKLISNNIIEALQRQFNIVSKWNNRDPGLIANSGGEGGMKESVSHLDEINWEVCVVDSPDVNAICFPGGKILVFSGALSCFPSDAEIATIIGHEVGHVVARHMAETLTVILGLFILQIMVFESFNIIGNILVSLFISQKMEYEADYIGMFLMASAGYDPQVAVAVYASFDDEIVEENRWLRWIQEHFSTHPSGKKRAKVLAQTKVMEEALSVYRKMIIGQA